MLALRERFMQPSFALARQIEAILLDAAEGKALDMEAFTAVLEHYGSDLNADELKLNLAML